MFGLKQLRISNDTVFVVEGYFDVLTLHQAGFKNTVGLLGTELSAEQMRILENLARNAILIFDGDPGGQAALLRCLKVPRHNLIVKAVILPEGDPDEIVREGRTAEFEALIEKAKPLQRGSDRDHQPEKGKGEHRATDGRGHSSRNGNSRCSGGKPLRSRSSRSS